jgi:regulator of sigma E protease
LPGDIIISANEEILRNTLDLRRLLEQNPDFLVLEYERNGLKGQAEFNSEDLGGLLGITWATVNYRTPRLSPPAALAKGAMESWNTLTASIRSLRLLFMGIDLTQAVSGPLRITYMIGDIAAHGFDQGIGTGFRSIAQFIALISIALGIMNMLPLPIIDGGMIILFLVELIRGKPAHPKVIHVFQTCGIVIISGLLLFAVFGDIMYFAHR